LSGKADSLVHVPGLLYLGGSSRLDPVEEGRGWLTAVDVSTSIIRWRYGSHRPMLAAVTATSADLLFTGELDGDFLVLDARDGAVLYRYATGAAMNGGVVTYQVNGAQYVAVTSGSANRFWRTSPRPARVTIFSVPTPTEAVVAE
jgi:glucose dehydrogenase